MQVMTAELSSGVKVHVQYTNMYQALRDLHSAGINVGQQPVLTNRSTPETRAKAEKARERSDACFKRVEAALEAMLVQAVEDTWERAMAAQKPFRCSNCRERFETAHELMKHATSDMTPDACWKAFELDLRVAATSTLAEPKGESNAT